MNIKTKCNIFLSLNSKSDIKIKLDDLNFQFNQNQISFWLGNQDLLG